VGVVTNAGGPGILLADACEAQGLKLTELAPDTVATLRGFLPPQASLTNPVDMIASASAEQYARAIEAVGGDPNIDALIVIHIPRLETEREAVESAIRRGAGTVPKDKPVLTVSLSPEARATRTPADGTPPGLEAGRSAHLPAYAFPENAARALAAAERYGRWRRRPAGRVLTLDRFAQDAIRAVVDRVLAAADGPRWLDPGDLATVLGAAGIPYAASEVVAPEEAPAAAETLGFPLVAKVVSADIVHKSDVGGVVRGLQTAAAVREAVGLIAERMLAAHARLEGILLQREISAGIEALVGVTTDPTFGPLVVCGLGGVLVELLRDASFRLTPVSDVDASEMIAHLRSAPLLDGYRGSPPGDKPALAAVIQRISALVEIVPELRELDLNPVKVLAPGQGAIAVDGRMRIGPLVAGRA
jgi:acyl-CoA synthetase (NDP forming)